MSDNLDSFPVHRREGTALTSQGLVKPDSDLYTDQEIYNFGIHGPFLQTLFLGCSVVNFNVNLGWGSESSSLTVSLVEDTSNHWLSSESRNNNNIIDNDINLPFNINKQTFESYKTSARSPDRIAKQHPQDGNTQVKPTTTPDNPNINQELHKNILLKEKQKNDEAITDNANRALGTPNRSDYGKVYYEFLYNGAWVKKFWKRADPGFVGLCYDILGTPVRFVFNDFEFTGIVTSWKNNGGSGGKNLYTVEIKSFSALLKNTQLIIDYYPGTIFRKTNTKPPVLSSLDSFGMPSNNIGDRVGRLGTNDVTLSDYEQSKFVGKITEGNIANVFNIYGYLESIMGWGKHDINQEGTLVKDILAAIYDLINKSTTTELRPTTPDSPLIIDARFSPYARIIGKAPAITKEENEYTVDNNLTVKFLKDKYTIINPFDENFKKLIEFQMPENTLPLFEERLISPDFNANDGNTSLKLNEMGLLPAYIASDGVIRQHYTLDLSDLPPVPSGYRIKGPVISILDLVQNICDANNYDFFVDFEPIRNSIKIKTVSRQNQPPNNYINQLIKDSTVRESVTSYDYGLEFHDEATIRSLYIGGKQQRLLQLSSNFLSRKNNGLLFDPKAGEMLDHNLSNITNVLRSPDPFCVRNPIHQFYSDLNNINAYLGSGTGAIIFEENNDIGGDRWNWGTNIGKGNYGHNITYNQNSEYGNYKNTDNDIFADFANILFVKGLESEVTVGEMMEPGQDLDADGTQIKINYPLWDDFICPYFGTNPDGTIRKVYYDSSMQQLQIVCSVTDIQNILGYAITKSANISYTETEQPPVINQISYDSVTSFNLLDGFNSTNVAAQELGNVPPYDKDVKTFHTEWNLQNREYYDQDSKFLILENEIRAAIAGFDSWVYYTFNKNFTTDLGKMLRLTMMTPTGLIVGERGVDNPETKSINEGDPVINMVYHGADPHIVGDTASESPSSSSYILSDRINDMLQKVHSYVKNIGDTYYGKQFMVKVPGLSISRDKPIKSIKDFSISYDDLSFDVSSYNGAGKLYSNYKPATDGAWEEPGNVIDDTIIVGSITGDFFTTDDGRFGPIVGYNATYEYLNDTIPDETLDNSTKPDLNTTTPNDTKVTFVKSTGGTEDFKTNYTSFDNIGSPAGFTVTQTTNSMKQMLPLSTDEGDFPSANPPTLAMILAQSSQPATGVDIIPNEWYPSLVTSLSNSEYLYYPYNFPSYPNVTQLSPFTFCSNIEMSTTAFGGKQVITSNTDLGEHLKYKIYAKAEIEPNFIFLRTNSSSPNYREPRAILKIGSAIECNPVHLADKYVHHCLMLDASIFKLRTPTVPTEVYSSEGGTKIGGLSPFKGGFGSSTSIITYATDHFLDALNAIDKDPDRAVTMPIAPKAAMPGFAAVPLQSQAAVYGPWTNHPWLVRKEIFTDPDISNDDNSIKDAINNLVGGLKVQIAEELCPWNFGGMKNLDMEAISRLESDASYQLSQEYGVISIPGSPVYRLGDFLDKTSEYTSGPIINSIRANIAENGVSTEYSLRTFSRKFGLFNKENSQRAAQISAERISRRKQIALQAAEISNRNISTLRSTTLNEAPKRDYVNPPLAESWRSASELLVGHNDMSFRLPSEYTRQSNLNIQEGIRQISGLIEYDASWGFAPRWKSNEDLSVINYPKIFSNTKIMDSRESVSHLQSNYENTSFMSLDGILSPISFYPTENFRTYHITKYPRRVCRYCFGKGKLDYSVGLPGLLNSLNAETVQDLTPDKTQAKTPKVIECPFCEPEANKVDQLLSGSSRGRVSPPFILTNTNDTIDSNTNLGEVNGLTTHKTAGVVINYSTLNPATIAYGEFSNFQNRQKGDNTGHSIKMIGHGTIPPNRGGDSLNQMTCADNRLYKNNLEYDQLYLDKVNELRNIPQNQRNANIQKLIDALPDKPRPFANNARFFGFRGPMMLHGWGYDTEGYPVPNSSGELKYDNNLNPIKATGVEDSNYVVNIFKNQEFIEVDEETAQNLDPNILLVLSPDGSKQGYWTEPKKETTFAKGWAQIPSTWPVGPIDLRWDQKAKVWTIPSTYKNVYVLLEEDLNDNIARGELVDNSQDIEDKLKPLGYRKVVYVKDKMGIYAAPRSSIVYCAYDEDGGFYEPISQSTFSTSGEIISSTTVNLYKIFQKTIAGLSNSITMENEPATYIATYSNPLDLNVNPGDIALFTFMKNGWVVQAGRG